MPEASIRKAETADVATLVSLARDSFREAYEATDDADEIEDYVTGHFTDRHFEQVLADSHSSLVLVECEKQAVGYVHVRLGNAPDGIDAEQPLELARIYLLGDFTGRGIGQLMMSWVLGEAERAGCDAIWLQVYELNERARAFYRHYGFADVGTRAFEFGGRIYHDPLMLRRL